MQPNITLNTPFPIGKYRGQPLQTVLADADYMQWFMSQTDITSKHPALVNFLVNGPLKGSQDTESHNRMQVRLLDKGVVLNTLQSAFKVYAEAEELVIDSVRFEVFNWDAVITTSCNQKGRDDALYRSSNRIAVELKPTVSEDYPAVLRQVTNRVQADRACRRAVWGGVLVLAERIHAKSATKEQMVQMFKASGIKLHEWNCFDFLC